MSGEVVSVGKEVRAFAVGDRVLGLVRGARTRSWSWLPPRTWAKIPAGLDVIGSGGAPARPPHGAQLIEDAVKPAGGDVVLVTGALGSVGRVAVFAAKKAGAKVWAGVRGSQRAEAASLGADGIVALDDDADIAKLPMLDAIADTVGGDAIKKLYGKLKPGGVLGSVLGEPAGARERGIVVHAFSAHPDSATLARYAAAVGERKLVIPIAKKVPLASAGEAQRLAEKGHPRGKVLLLG